MDQNDRNNKNRRGNRNSNLLGAGKPTRSPRIRTATQFIPTRIPPESSRRLP